MRAERRQAYRVATSGHDAIRADITGDSGRAVGDVLDLSLTGAAVRIATAQDPTFAIGELVTAFFHSGDSDPIEVQARIEARSELDDSRRFSLAFPDPAALRDKLTSGLLQIFNQRKAFRVEMKAATPVEAQVRVEGFEAIGRLQNISEDGVAVLLDAQVEDRLASSVGLTLTFQLPGDDRALVFSAVIRNRCRAEDESKVCYGLRLDPTNSSNFPAQRRCIVDYVMRRQRESLQSRVER